MKELIQLADDLDKRGLHAEADEIDRIIQAWSPWQVVQEYGIPSPANELGGLQGDWFFKTVYQLDPMLSLALTALSSGVALTLAAPFLRATLPAIKSLGTKLKELLHEATAPSVAPKKKKKKKKKVVQQTPDISEKENKLKALESNIAKLSEDTKKLDKNSEEYKNGIKQLFSLRKEMTQLNKQIENAKRSAAIYRLLVVADICEDEGLFKEAGEMRNLIREAFFGKMWEKMKGGASAIKEKLQEIKDTIPAALKKITEFFNASKEERAETVAKIPKDKIAVIESVATKLDKLYEAIQKQKAA